PAMQTLVSDIEIARNTASIPHPYPDGGAIEWIRMHESLEEAIFAIIKRDSEELIGTIGLILKPHERAEIGYWIGVPFWNHGYASEAARAVIAFGFETLALNRIEAAHYARNPASGRVMVNAGMKHEGTHRQAVKKWDEYLDTEMYSILR